MTAKFGMLISAKTTGANDIKRLGNSMQGVQGKAKNLGNAVKGVGTAFKALFAAAAIAGFSRLVTGAIDSADAFGKLSTRTGIAANKLQAYANAGKLADVSQSDLETGLRTLARTQAEAADGVATYSEAYAKLGVGVKKADGSLKPSDKLLGEIADKFKDLPNGPEKAAIAMDIFGRSGSKLITLLNGGSEALERFNYETSENFAQNAEYFNDQIAVLQIRFDGFRKQLADALLPALNAIMEVFQDLFASDADFSALFDVIGVGVRGIAFAVLGVTKAIDELVRLITTAFKIVDAARKFDFSEVGKLGEQYGVGVAERFQVSREQFNKILFGTGEVGADYGGGRTGGFTPVTINNEDSTGEKATSQRNSALSKGLDITLKQTASFAKLLQGLEDERRLLEAKILGKEKEVALDMKVEEKTRGMTPEIAAGVEQRIRGNAALQETIDKTKDLNTNTEKTNTLFESIKSTVETGLTNAIMGLIDGTKSLGDSLSGVLRQMASLFLRAGIGSFGSGGEPGTGLLGLFAKGGVFAQNNVVPFAYGGVVNRPTLFPMANGMGLMGEAGPEAIMPLRRGRGGRLGVESAGGGATNVNVSVDASGSSVEGNGDQAAQLGKAIGIAVQQELIKQKRPGGLLTS